MRWKHSSEREPMATSPDEHKGATAWDDHARAQRRRMAALPLVEKLAWLEEAQRLAAVLGARKPVVTSSDDLPVPDERR